MAVGAAQDTPHHPHPRPSGGAAGRAGWAEVRLQLAVLWVFLYKPLRALRRQSVFISEIPKSQEVTKMMR